MLVYHLIHPISVQLSFEIQLLNSHLNYLNHKFVNMGCNNSDQSQSLFDELTVCSGVHDNSNVHEDILTSKFRTLLLYDVMQTRNIAIYINITTFRNRFSL